MLVYGSLISKGVQGQLGVLSWPHALGVQTEQEYICILIKISIYATPM